MNKQDKIYIAGYRGLVGSAIVRNLEASGYNNLVLRTSKELNLTSQADVNAFFEQEKPDYVFLAAARVGGIHANDTYPVDFIRDNLQIQTNVIDAAYRNNAKKTAFPRFVLHLSKIRTTANERRASAHRRAGANQ